MYSTRRTQLRPRQGGASLIEVLVSMVILMIGLLGLVGIMIQSQRSQLESYQRVQALTLVQDMAARLASNKTAASCYVLPTYIGTGNTTVPGCAGGNARYTQDMTEWRNMLLGNAEVAAGSSVGSVLGARGCISNVGGSTYQISVAWQGSGKVTAPPAGISCGQGLYGDEAARRAVSLTVQVTS